MAADRRTADLDPEILHLIFDRLQEKVLRRNEDEKHAADKQKRRAIDALRSRIKRLEPPVRVMDTWEQVRPRIEKLEEYRALDSDEIRQTAFEKVIRRLKEKEEDAEKDRDRDRDRTRRDYHDRSEREHRNGQAYSHRDIKVPSGRPSRTPELDPYEADRRRAQADRERSYRKASGISPTHDRRDSDRGTRDRDRDRDRDRRSLSHYERERRDREEERERLYRTRADLRSSRDELDYGGDSRSTVSNGERRRRRDSDAESVVSRSTKRHRRDDQERERDQSHDQSRDRSSKVIGSRRDRDRRRSRERDPMEADEERKEEKAVHSGSEEGEIEEE